MTPMRPEDERITTDPMTGTTVREVHHRSGNSGWWIAALVAIVAILGIVFMTNNRNTQAELQAAQDQGRASAMIDNATQEAREAAASASAASSQAVDSMAAASQSAADSAKAAADRTAQAAQSATDQAGDAAATVADPDAPR